MSPRSRTGCWTCRDRSVKCDERRPDCSKCRRSGLACIYGVRLTWVEDSLARGVCHGRQGTAAQRRKRRSGAVNQQHLGLDGFSPTSPRSTSGSLPSGSLGDRSARRRRFFLNTTTTDISIYFQAPTSPRVNNTSWSRMKSTPWCTSNDPVFPAQESTYPSNHIDTNDRVSDIANEDLCLDFSHVLTPNMLSGRWSPLFGSLSDNDAYLLEYYDAAVCSRATLIDERNHNPLRHIILPLAATSPRVYHGVLAVAASKLAATREVYSRTALTHRHLVLAGLRQLLANMNPNAQDIPEALAAAVLLCWFEIADSCRPTWTNHLHAMSTLLGMCGHHNPISACAEGVIDFCKQYFAYHLVMAKTIFRVNELTPGTVEESQPQDGSTASNLALCDPYTAIRTQAFDGKFLQLLELDPVKSHRIDTHQGFSNSLLLLINEVCDLRNIEVSEAVSDTSASGACVISKKVDRVEKALEQLNQLLPEMSSSEEGALLRPEPLRHHNSNIKDNEFQRKMHTITTTAEAHRLGALLFLDETCALCWPDIQPRTRQRREDLVEQIFELVSSIETEHLTAAYPIWPLFVAACIVTTDQQRVRVLDIFGSIEKSKRFGSYPPARAVVEMVWRQQDLTSDENPRTSSNLYDPFRLWSKASARPKGLQGALNLQEERQRSRSLSSSNKSSLYQCGCDAFVSSLNRAQYSWEQAMSMLGGWRLSLT